MKAGKLRALVATASLELGIDIGDVDLVCQIGSTRSITAFLQRVGRSGHGIDRIPKGRLFPLSRDELVECVALLEAVKQGDLDRLRIVRMTGYVCSAPGFFGQAQVVNGASELMAAVLGDAGVHARVAVGVTALPLEAAVELEVIAEMR